MNTVFDNFLQLASFKDVHEMSQREIVTVAAAFTAERLHRVNYSDAIVRYIDLHVFNLKRIVMKCGIN